MITRLQSIGFLFFSLVHGSSDYTLASFDSTPIFNLSPACLTAYTSTIPFCQPADFNALNPCSVSCTQALQSLQTQTQSSCDDEQQPILKTSILAYFANGTGVEELCSTMKRDATTMATIGVAPTGTGSGVLSTNAASTSAASSNTATSMDGGSPFNRGAVLAVVISIIVGIIVLFFVAILLYRKYYR